MSQDVYEKIRAVYEKFKEISGGIEYIEEVVSFLNNADEHFVKYWRFERGLGVYRVYIIIPYWSDGSFHYRVNLVEISADEKISVEEIVERISKKKDEIIGILMRGLENFLEQVLAVQQQDDC